MIEPNQNSTTAASDSVPPAKANAEAEAEADAKAKKMNRRYWLILAGIAAASILLAWVLRLVVSPAGELFSGASAAGKKDKKFIPLREGTWRFIVSGDSRNCGDVVVPTIASDSEQRYAPSFYWHLGDLRAIYKIDEDMAYAELANGHYLGCENYVKRAWPDFIEHQIAPFGSTPLYLGIGNHEVIPPKGFPSGTNESKQPEINEAQFTAEFKDWLLPATVKEQRLKDKDCDPPQTISGTKTSTNGDCLVLPRNYYHWIQGGVDFIYLDNASNVFGDKQLKWFQDRLTDARKNDAIRSVVVGMHEALPKSISADHAMCDITKEKDSRYPFKLSCDEGGAVYKALLDFQTARPIKYVYVLASHSHFYMQGIFNSRPEGERLPGWIVGTAGAVRYSLPTNQSAKPDDARTNVYGYLLGTVDPYGKIEFKFQEVREQDIPAKVRQQYPDKLVNWCFARNSEEIDPNAPETTTRCPSPAPPTPTPSPKK
jgi:hypothetical protein